MRGSLLGVRGARARAALLALVALSAIGCAYSPAWAIIRQTEPSPFAGKKDFVVLPVDYEGSIVDGELEEEYLFRDESMTPDELEELKASIESHFVEHLQAEAGSKGVRITPAAGVIRSHVVRPRVTVMQSDGSPNRLVMRVQLEDEEGKVIDEIEIESEAYPTRRPQMVGTPYERIVAPTIESRWDTVAGELGRSAAMYLVHRVRGR